MVKVVNKFSNFMKMPLFINEAPESARTSLNSEPPTPPLIESLQVSSSLFSFRLK